MNHGSHQDYCDAQVARFAFPDDFPVLGFDGKTLFARNRLMRCPSCEGPFFAYQPVNAPLPPHGTDPQPDVLNGVPVAGVRRTCGHPNCVAAEDREQHRRRIGLLAHHSLDPEPNVTQAKPRPRLQRAGEMGATR